MKKLNTIILILLFPFVISAQNFITIGEVFDFEIGDEFQIEGRGYNQPPNADRITITDKYYSSDSNTVFYVRFHDSYLVYLENGEAHYHFWTETDTVSYTNLDTCITHSNFWASYDTSMIYYDTINYISEDYCDSLLNGYSYEINSFEPVDYSGVYGKGRIHRSNKLCTKLSPPNWLKSSRPSLWASETWSPCQTCLASGKKSVIIDISRN